MSGVISCRLKAPHIAIVSASSPGQFVNIGFHTSLRHRRKLLLQTDEQYNCICACASALKISTPLRMPPSKNLHAAADSLHDFRKNFCCCRALDPAYTSAVIGYTMAAAPASFAFNAPFTVTTPFTINRRTGHFPVAFRSSTDSPPAGGSIFFRNGRSAASTSIATAKHRTSSQDPSSHESYPDSTASLSEHPMPSANAIASVAASITFGFVPSPVKQQCHFLHRPEAKDFITRNIIICISICRFQLRSAKTDRVKGSGIYLAH